jgi:sulfatase modifying factor 1
MSQSACQLAAVFLLAMRAIACGGQMGADELGSGSVGPAADSGPVVAEAAVDQAIPEADEVDPSPDASATCPVKMVAVQDSTGQYCIDSTEVTYAAYAAFVAADFAPSLQDAVCAWNKSFLPLEWPPTSEMDGLPVRAVDWCDAVAYCRWNGKHLCGGIGGGAVPWDNLSDASTSQWYRACSASGTRTYPYSDVFDPLRCNGFAYSVAHGAQGKTIPVGSEPSCEGGYTGVFDMSGNVWEWEDACDGTTGESDLCSARGGSSGSQSDELACAFVRPVPRSSVAVAGFRCCSG